MTKTILLCGVGGQGTILAAHIMADVALRCGLDVKVSEIHGMSQRGGAVTTVVRFGEDVASMVCDKGSADVVISFEILEAIRNFDQLAEGGTLITSDEIIKPASVLTGNAQLPSNPRGLLMDAGAMIVPTDAIAKEAGNAKAANVVLLGAVSGMFDFPIETWLLSIGEHVPEKYLDVNLKAFELGRSFEQKHGR